MQENSLQAGQHLQASPLESHLRTFVTSLLEDGYADATVHDKLSLLDRGRPTADGKSQNKKLVKVHAHACSKMPANGSLRCLKTKAIVHRGDSRVLVATSSVTRLTGT